MRNKKLIILFSILAFVTLLTVIGSVLFSVQSVYGSCYNLDDEITCERVADLSVNGIDKGKSVFLLNEKEIAASVEASVSDVRVINIERKFPNTVYINFVKVFPYLALETEGGALLVANDGKIVSTCEKQAEYPDHIRYVSATPTGTANGERAYGDGTAEDEMLMIVNDAIARVGKHAAVMEMFSVIDTSKTAENGLTYFVTRTGTCFELQGGADNLLKKLRLAVSVFVSEETKYMTGGTIIVNASGEKAWHDDEFRYGKF